MSLLVGWFAVGGGRGRRWSKGILEFCFCPNLGLRLEAGTKLNNIIGRKFLSHEEIYSHMKKVPVTGRNFMTFSFTGRSFL